MTRNGIVNPVFLGLTCRSEHLQAELAGESAKELNRSLLSALRRAEILRLFSLGTVNLVESII